MNRLKLVVGAAGAAALVIGTGATPAIAASQDIDYSCQLLGPTSVGIDPGNIPATMVAGQKSKRTMNLVVHLTAEQAALAAGQTVSGTIVSTGARNSFPFNMTIPPQSVPVSPGATDITASGPGTIRPLKAGTWTVKAGDLAANLTLSTLGQVADTCTAPTDGSATYGTITVSKDKTTTAVTAAYNAKKDVASGKAKVRSHFGLKATGKVVFTLKKGAKRVAKAAGTLNKKGIATHAFKHVKKHGKYSITAKYVGNSNLKGSSGKDAFRVS